MSHIGAGVRVTLLGAAVGAQLVRIPVVPTFTFTQLLRVAITLQHIDRLNLLPEGVRAAPEG